MSSNIKSAIITANDQLRGTIVREMITQVGERNGPYIDTDLDAIPDYKKEGKIANCEADEKYAYTSREELARTYAHITMDDSLNGQVYNLRGEAVTQQELTTVINSVFNLGPIYESISVDANIQDRVKAHGDFLGYIIVGIYQGIYDSAFDIPSDYRKICGWERQSLKQKAEEFKAITQQ
ncbi:MAG: hypothetical protein JSV17_02075 [Candidatus Aminicenantes bacterium]|nr:MAG: hypothetical protein JSV17_02075 [Candidatus Aminicenantes bacterium]